MTQESSNDHDILIEVRTLVKVWHEESQRALQEHQKDDIAKLTLLDSKVAAAHSRMDEMKKETLMALNEVAQEIKGFGSLKDRVLGGACVLMFIFSTVVSLISLLKH